VVNRCLIVDDSQPFLVSARALLESQGMTVAACARSGDDALAIAKNAKPDVALVDVELAGEDGFVLARSLIAQDPALCVILISAYEFEDVAELVVGCGADHVVPAAVDRQMAKRQSKSGAVTEYKEFPGRSHFTLGQDGWEEVADYALDWAVEHARVPATA
jgi:DNA-binding NarL/FixJ family response regulator